MKQTTYELTKGGEANRQADTAPDHQQVEALAYQLWLERGSPDGSPEIDWSRAEEQLRGTHIQRAA